MPVAKSFFRSGESTPVNGRFQLVGISDGNKVYFITGKRFQIDLFEGGSLPYISDCCKLACIWRLCGSTTRPIGIARGVFRRKELS